MPIILITLLLLLLLYIIITVLLGMKLLVLFWPQAVFSFSIFSRSNILLDMFLIDDYIIFISYSMLYINQK